MNDITENSNSTQESVEFYTEKRAKSRNGFIPYLIAFAVVFVICVVSALFRMTNTRSITITINSASVSKGQNPDGTPFDIYQILSDEVLKAAAQKLDGDVSADDLKLHLSVCDALSADANHQMKQSILDGQHENAYFPAVYQVTYTKMAGTFNLKDAWTLLPGSDADQILEAVAESYQEYYEESYLTYELMFEIDWESIDAMDYYNRSEALRTEALRILRFLQDKADESLASGYSSDKLTYRDLENDMGQLINVDIENHQAYIIQNNITTARKELLQQFRYMEELYIEARERRTEEYLILDEAVDMYDSTTTKVVFIPALDQNDSFYMNRTKVGLDYLVEQADAARLAADEAEHNAQYYRYLQGCFAEAVTPANNKIAHADAIYQNIKDQMNTMVGTVKHLLKESNKTENEGIKVGSVKMAVSILGIALSFAKRFVIWSMAAYALVCIPSFFRRKKPAVSQEV